MNCFRAQNRVAAEWLADEAQAFHQDSITTFSARVHKPLVRVCLAVAALLQSLPGGAQLANPVTRIAAGHDHSLFVMSDGSLLGMGNNQSGQLGDGTLNAKTNRPEQIVSSGVAAIAAGSSHSLLLLSDGSLWATGDNACGELGDGTFSNANLPEQILAGGVVAIAAGNGHSLFLKTGGSLWAMGWNNHGQLGDGTYANTNRPEPISTGTVKAIAAGNGHSLILQSDGSLWAMGNNDAGQLGDGTFNPTNRPEQIVSENVKAVATLANHSLFLKRDGSLWAMGANAFGQLGDGSTNNANCPEQIISSNVMAIAAGDGFSLFLKNDGSLWGTGCNAHGQLGDGTTNNAIVPKQLISSNVTAVAAGGSHGLFLRNNPTIETSGNLWAMGWNYYGQLGDSTYGPATGGTSVPEQIVFAAPPFGLINYSNQPVVFFPNSMLGFQLQMKNAQTSNNWVFVNSTVPFTGLQVTNNGTLFCRLQAASSEVPALGLGICNGQPVLLFPAAAGANCVLQIKTNLAASSWTTVNNNASFIAQQITNATANTFFRLLHP